MTSGMDTSSRAADPIQDAVYSRVLMAAMAGRRTMVVSDYTGGNGAVIGRRMADYMSSSGGMALTATGYRNATLEDLLSEAAAGLGLKRSDDLEELALSLERALDAAGSGLLVIFDAHLLSAPVIGDLFELSASDTDSGLYMQILLTGGPGLDAQFDKPGLANAARQVASSRWRIENEAPPVEEERPAPTPPAPSAQSPLHTPREPAPRRGYGSATGFRAASAPQGSQSQSLRRAARPASGIPRARPVVAAGLLGARSWHSLRLRGGVRDERALALRPQKRHRVAEGGRPVRPDGQPAKHAPSPDSAPMEPQAQPEPVPAPSAPAPQTPAAAAPPPAPATQPAPQAAPPAAALPPEWNQPVERPRPSSTRNAPRRQRAAG